MIEFYPSKLDGAPVDTWPDGHVGTIESWLVDNVRGYSPDKAQRISARLNGRQVEHADWASTPIRPTDLLQFYAEPKGAELIIAAVTLGAAFTFVTGLFTPKLPGAGGQGAGQGDRLALASTKGNSAKLNSPIRELFGQRPVYPDYLLPPHRYFVSPREQVVELLLCVGVGRFNIPLSSVTIGDTPVISLGDIAELNIFQPGASLAARPEAVWWHSAPEVGSTSSGTAGMELTSTSLATQVARAQSYILDGDTITVPSGAGALPDDWETGMLVRIDARYTYTVTAPNLIEGDIAQLGLAPGDLIEVLGPNAGNYTVDTVDNALGELTLNYDNGAPAVLQPGTSRACIGPRGLRYRLLAASTAAIVLERLTSSGSTDAGWPGFSPATLFDAGISLDTTTQEGGWLGPFRACPDNEVTTRIEWDIFAPGGLIFVWDEGGVAPPFTGPGNTFTIEVQWRDAATAGAWTSISKQYSSDRSDQLGWTEFTDLPYAMQPEVRARRVGAKPTRVNTQSTLQWYGLRSRLNAPTSYAGVTTLTLTVGTSDTLASQAESLVSLTPTRILPARLGGVDLGEIPTRNPADAARYVISSAGYPISAIDLDEFDRFGDICHARGDWYDDAVDDKSTVKDVIADAFRVGFAEPTVEQGVIRPVRDEPRTEFDNTYSPQVMLGPLRRTFTAPAPDDIDGVDAEYFDSDARQWLVVPCRLPGDAGIRAEKVRIAGVTDPTRAWRIGMRRRRELKYRRKGYTFDTEMDALNSRYLSYDALSDDIPGYSQSALVLAYNATTRVIRSSEPLRWTEGAAHIVGVRRPNGSLSGPYPATRLDDYRLTLATPLDFSPVTDWSIEPAHLQFGTATTWAYPALVQEVTPNGTTRATVQAVNYDERVYADDNNSPP